MTKKEYAKHLGKIIAEDIDIVSDDLSCQFYGYFQSFMPKGDGLEKVFKPIKNGDLYFERLIKIYNATEKKFNELSKEGKSPGYFCPTPQKNKELLILNGEKYITNLKSFSKLVGNQEFIETMTEIKTVEITDSNKRNNENDTNTIVYESISDWFIDNTDFESTIEVLSEAYYSINCDYNLSYYFQYPNYKDKLKLDLFEPYFEIWKMGYYCWFDKGRLIVVK